MTFSLGVVMDPIDQIKYHKDSTLAMLLAAQARGFALWYMEPGDLSLNGDTPSAQMRPLRVMADAQCWYELAPPVERPLQELDVLLQRQDPPFDIEYVYTTYLLELAEQRGLLVVNRPRSLRDCNEKLFATWFRECIPPTVVSRRPEVLRRFLAEQGNIVVKPLGGMGGSSVFKIAAGDPNTNVILETLTERGRCYAMGQRYLPEISQGDKRILLIDGEPVPYALARIPAAGEFRGNLAAGGNGVGVPLTERDRWICAQVGPTLRERGLLFVGLDVIGDYLTEVNVTSPTCIQELDRQFGLDIAGELMQAIEQRLSARIG